MSSGSENQADCRASTRRPLVSAVPSPREVGAHSLSSCHYQPPFLQGRLESAQKEPGGIGKASPRPEQLKVCSSVPPCSLPGLMGCGSPEAASRGPVTSSLHLQTEPFRSAPLFGADTLSTLHPPRSGAVSHQLSQLRPTSWGRSQGRNRPKRRGWGSNKDGL